MSEVAHESQRAYLTDLTDTFVALFVRYYHIRITFTHSQIVSDCTQRNSAFNILWYLFWVERSEEILQYMIVFVSAFVYLIFMIFIDLIIITEYYVFFCYFWPVQCSYGQGTQCAACLTPKLEIETKSYRKTNGVFRIVQTEQSVYNDMDVSPQSKARRKT